MPRAKKALPSFEEIAESCNRAHPLKANGRYLTIEEIDLLLPRLSAKDCLELFATRTRLETRVRESLGGCCFNKEIDRFGRDRAWQVARALAFGHRDPAYYGKQAVIRETPYPILALASAICTGEAMCEFISYVERNELPVPYVFRDVYLTLRGIVNITNYSKILGHIKNLFMRPLALYAYQIEAEAARQLIYAMNEYQPTNACKKIKRPRVLPKPTSFAPGSMEKILEMAGRYLRGEELFHPDDNQAAIIDDCAASPIGDCAASPIGDCAASPIGDCAASLVERLSDAA